MDEAMQDFMKMDVFFVVTTAVVILGGVLLLTVLFYVIRILRSFDHLMRNVSEESDDFRKDLGVLRQKVRDEGMRVKHIVDLFVGSAGRMKARHAKVKHEKGTSSQ